MKRRAIIVVAVFVVLSLGAMAATGKLGGKKTDGPKAVPVVRGTLVDKALAVGTIEPRVEVSVKSILAGVVRQRFAAVGDFVKRGQPLLEISPNPTPLEMVELRRTVELREIELKNLERDLARQQELRSRNLISPADIEAAQQRVDESRNQLSLAQERLALQEGGKVLTGGKQVETVVRAPIDGYILEDSIEIGDPVVPLTPYQAGTVLMRMAAMRDLIFRGTVDEIDVGRLKEGMQGHDQDRRAAQRDRQGAARQDLAPGAQAGAGDGVSDRDRPDRGSGGDAARGLLGQRGGDHRSPRQRALRPRAAHHPPQRLELRDRPDRPG